MKVLPLIAVPPSILERIRAIFNGYPITDAILTAVTRPALLPGGQVDFPLVIVNEGCGGDDRSEGVNSA